MLQYIKKIALIFLFFLTTLSAISQEKFTSRGSYAEKIYLQLDKTTYTTGSKIWFKSIVTDAVKHIPSPLSKVIYVELIDKNKTIVERKILKINEGVSQGSFELSKNLREGQYLIRAYTEWNKNFDTDFFFEEYIFISKLASKDKSPIHNITLTKNQTNQTRLEANLSPLIIDNNHKGRLKVFVNIGNKKDTLLIKKGSDDLYSIDYLIESNNPIAEIEFETKNNQKFSKSIVLDQEQIDLQFFPESGEMVHGLSNKIGFKAIGIDGKGKFIEGKIYDEKDSLITSFKSNILGMGSFLIRNVNEYKTYYAKIKSKSNESLTYSLPKVASKGNIISINDDGNYFEIIATSNYMKNDSISIKLESRGYTYVTKRLTLQNGVQQLKVPKNILPEGIIKLTMVDNLSRPVAQRLYFNQRFHNRVDINITTDEKSFSKREVTHLTLKSTDMNGKPVQANMSLLVINKEQLGEKQQLRQNILSYFLINSELKGTIENPGYYFNSADNKSAELDNLMLTQGWRKYNYSKPVTQLKYQPESNLSISGRVNRGAYAKKFGEEIEITMMAFGKERSFYKQKTDSLGNFKFDLLDEYGGLMPITLQTAKKSGKRKNYTIRFNEKKSPLINFSPPKSNGILDSLTQKFIDESEKRKKKEDEYLTITGTQVLDEVVLKGYRLTPNRKKVMDRLGKPDMVISNKELMEKEENWSYGIYSVIRYRFPKLVRIIDNRRFGIFAQVIGSDGTVVVIDGNPVHYRDMQIIPYIRKKEISSFEIIRCTKDVYRLWKDVTGQPFPPPSVHCLGVISIYTYAKKGLQGLKRTKGITKATVPVFSKPQEFYAPKYENRSAIDWMEPDLRDVVYWKPIIKTDQNGQASATYYNTDLTGKFTIIVEAISKDGKLGYKEISYQVKD